jgi:hypothetical protein
LLKRPVSNRCPDTFSTVLPAAFVRQLTNPLRTSTRERRD